MRDEAPPTDEPMVALHRLLEAAGRGYIDEVCDRLGVELLGVFGSAYRRFRHAQAPAPRDLDLAVAFRGPSRLLDLLDELVLTTGYDRIDLAVLDGANPVLRAEALAGLGLYERTKGQWAVTQMAAFAERRDTAWMRRLDLEILSR